MFAPGASARYLSKNYLSKHYLSKKDFKRLRDDRYLEFTLIKTTLIPVVFTTLLAWQSPAMPASDGGDDDWGDVRAAR